jgi:hypothetical protein
MEFPAQPNAEVDHGPCVIQAIGLTEDDKIVLHIEHSGKMLSVFLAVALAPTLVHDLRNLIEVSTDVHRTLDQIDAVLETSGQIAR